MANHEQVIKQIFKPNQKKQSALAIEWKFKETSSAAIARKFRKSW